jgi:dTDP-4-amino-4,6-dideoxygalactose transaminase
MADVGMPSIPVFDIRMEPEDVEAVATSLRSGELTSGPRSALFEEAFAERIGVAHAITVSSCTAALHLAYLAAGVGPGDEVIVPSFTFAATAAAVRYCGAEPVFADIIGLDDPSIDPEQVAQLMSARTKAVAAVHFGGYAAPVDVLADLCREHGVALIEDVAHAPQATLAGKSLGSFGLASAFSFFSNKVLPLGEGGMLVTDDDRVAAETTSLRSHGMTPPDTSKGLQDGYDVERAGYNYRLDEARSALALARLRRLDEDIATRRAITFRYRSLLGSVPGIEVPYTDDGVERSSCYVMAIFVKKAEERDELRRRLLEKHGIQTTVLYPAIHEFTAYHGRYRTGKLETTERAARSAVMLPMFPHLTEEQQDLIVAAVEEELG